MNEQKFNKIAKIGVATTEFLSKQVDKVITKLESPSTTLEEKVELENQLRMLEGKLLSEMRMWDELAAKLDQE